MFRDSISIFATVHIDTTPVAIDDLSHSLVLSIGNDTSKNF